MCCFANAIRFISLSSTAVVLKILQDWGELDSDVGQDVLGVLLVQNLAIIPMLIVIGFLGGEVATMGIIVLEAIGGVIMLGLFTLLIMKDTIHLPLVRWLKDDHEMQVFAAFIICFGLTLFTGVMGLSTALGAFAARMLVATPATTFESKLTQSCYPLIQKPSSCPLFCYLWTFHWHPKPVGNWIAVKFNAILPNYPGRNVP